MRRQDIATCIALAILVGALGLPTPSSAEDHGRRASEPAQADVAPSTLPPSMREWLKDLEPELRRPAVKRLRRMPPARRRAFFERWSTMSQAERERVMRRLEEHARHQIRRRNRDDRWPDRHPAQAMTPNERKRFASGAKRWRDMSAKERAAMRRRLARFHSLDDAEQRELIARAFPDASASERAEKLEQLRATRPGERARD